MRNERRHLRLQFRRNCVVRLYITIRNRQAASPPRFASRVHAVVPLRDGVGLGTGNDEVARDESVAWRQTIDEAIWRHTGRWDSTVGRRRRPRTRSNRPRNQLHRPLATTDSYKRPVINCRVALHRSVISVSSLSCDVQRCPADGRDKNWSTQRRWNYFNVIPSSWIARDGVANANGYFQLMLFRSRVQPSSSALRAVYALCILINKVHAYVMLYTGWPKKK